MAQVVAHGASLQCRHSSTPWGASPRRRGRRPRPGARGRGGRWGAGRACRACRSWRRCPAAHEQVRVGVGQPVLSAARAAGRGRHIAPSLHPVGPSPWVPPQSLALAGSALPMPKSHTAGGLDERELLSLACLWDVLVWRVVVAAAAGQARQMARHERVQACAAAAVHACYRLPAHPIRTPAASGIPAASGPQASIHPFLHPSPLPTHIHTQNPPPPLCSLSHPPVGAEGVGLAVGAAQREEHQLEAVQRAGQLLVQLDAASLGGGVVGGWVVGG